MISVAVQKGNYVYVFDEKNHQIAVKFGELHGFTGATYSIKKDRHVYTFDEKNHQISVKYVG